MAAALAYPADLLAGRFACVGCPRRAQPLHHTKQERSDKGADEGRQGRLGTASGASVQRNRCATAGVSPP